MLLLNNKDKDINLNLKINKSIYKTASLPKEYLKQKMD